MLVDPSKYLTLDFVNYLINRLLESKRDKEAEKILLDTRVSVNLYPEAWNLYIERQIKSGRFEQAIALIDDLKTKTINEIVPKL